MASCGRCCVEQIIRRYGMNNVLEKRNGEWREIYVATNQPTHPKNKTVKHEGRIFGWAMSVMSDKHSNDDDCWQEKYTKPADREIGFPVIQLEINREQITNQNKDVTDR